MGRDFPDQEALFRYFNSNTNSSSNPFYKELSLEDKQGQKLNKRDSNFGAFVKLLGTGLNFNQFLVPIVIKDLGVSGMAITLAAATCISIYTIWLQLKSEKCFRSEFVRPSSLQDLIYLCFGNGVIGMFHFF